MLLELRKSIRDLILQKIDSHYPSLKFSFEENETGMDLVFQNEKDLMQVQSFLLYLQMVYPHFICLVIRPPSRKAGCHLKLFVQYTQLVFNY